MPINSSSLRDMLNSLLDTVSSEPDPVVRFRLLDELLTVSRTRLTVERRKAMYEARLQAPTVKAVMDATGLSRPTVMQLVKAHIANTHAAPIPPRKKKVYRTSHTLTV